MTDTQSVPAIVLRRTYNAPRQRVFEAWTNPEIAVRFLGPGDVKAADVTMDVRTGGSYRIVMLLPDGEKWGVGGTYREVRAPERLAMTWRWDSDDPSAPEHESLLTLEFHERGSQTELVLTHERFAKVESRDQHEHGWTLIVDQLASVL